jgi:hypothetical protein
VIILDELQAKMGAGDGLQAKKEHAINELFTAWSKTKSWTEQITNSDIQLIWHQWGVRNGDDHTVDLNRPKLLAMMRLVDDDRSGAITFSEFRRFVLGIVEEREAEEHRSFGDVVSSASAKEQSSLGGGNGPRMRAILSFHNIKLSDLRELGVEAGETAAAGGAGAGAGAGAAEGKKHNERSAREGSGSPISGMTMTDITENPLMGEKAQV